MHRYFIIYKPYLVLSQFTAENEHQSLKDFFSVPKDVYPVGRLDHDSEGLLILTNDRQLNHLLLHPSHQHVREYRVQVDGSVTEEAIGQLQQGVDINIGGIIHRTKPCEAMRIEVPDVAERNPPVRFRKNIPTSWISINLAEGKNRQVRKMTAAVGFPTLRLIRYRIEEITLGTMRPGDIVEMPATTMYRKLHLNSK